jgi:hypothetical protein
VQAVRANYNDFATARHQVGDEDDLDAGPTDKVLAELQKELEKTVPAQVAETGLGKGLGD